MIGPWRQVGNLRVRLARIEAERDAALDLADKWRRLAEIGRNYVHDIAEQMPVVRVSPGRAIIVGEPRK